MTDPEKLLGKGVERRRKAEEIIRMEALLDLCEALSPEATQQILHELRVHQIELEMQNEELRRAQIELEASQARYFDLYELAPVGYVSLNEQGLILEANLTATALLGVARGALTHRPISRFILKQDQDIYYRHRQRLAEKGEQQACELRMLKKDGTPFWAHLEATAARAGDGTCSVYRLVVSDISRQKFQEEALQKALHDIKTLRGIVPICAWCKKIRDDEGYWSQVEVYVHNHSEAEFTHGICPECREKLKPELEQEGKCVAEKERGPV